MPLHTPGGPETTVQMIAYLNSLGYACNRCNVPNERGPMARQPVLVVRYEDVASSVGTASYGRAVRALHSFITALETEQAEPPPAAAHGGRARPVPPRGGTRHQPLTLGGAHPLELVGADHVLVLAVPRARIVCEARRALPQ